MRRLVPVSLALLLLATLAPGANGSVDRLSEHRIRSGIEALLQQRAVAVRRKDERAFMATVSGTSAFRASQRRFFTGITSLPLGTYSLVAAWGRFGDLARPSDRAAYPQADQIEIPLTQERYRLRGFDRSPAQEDMYYTFVHHHGHWRIASDSDLTNIGFDSARDLWDFGKISVERSRDLLVLTGKCSKQVPGQCVAPPSGVAALESAGVSRVDHFWPGRWSHKVVLVEPASQSELGRLLQATFPLDNFVAFAYANLDVARRFSLTGGRILLNPPVIAKRDASNLLVTLSHELVHIATRHHAGPFTPAWVDEGIAEYIGYAEDPSSLSFLASKVASGTFKAEIPPDYEFTTGSGKQIYDAYQRAESAVRFFVQRWGIERFVAFYDRLGARRIAPGTTTYQVDTAMRQTIGMGLAAFRRAWADSIGA